MEQSETDLLAKDYNAEKNSENLKSRIEAVLFVTAKVLQISEIAEILQEEPDVVEEALLELIMDYASREGALEIDDENGYILQVKQEHLDIVEKLCPVELKPPVLKTLTVIALKEPIRQTVLKDLRGSNAYEHVQELLEKADYYLAHGDERRRIAENGYLKICKDHTYGHRVNEILSCIN